MWTVAYNNNNNKKKIHKDVQARRDTEMCEKQPEGSRSFAYLYVQGVQRAIGSQPHGRRAGARETVHSAAITLRCFELVFPAHGKRQRVGRRPVGNCVDFGGGGGTGRSSVCR